MIGQYVTYALVGAILLLLGILVLAAGTGAEGPGPLISYLTGKPAARLRIPITIVPGGLTLDEIDALS